MSRVGGRLYGEGLIHWGPAASSPESHRLGGYAMTTTASTAVVVYDPGLVDPEHVALAGFLGGYRGLTRDAYALDLRQFVVFCDRRHLSLFEVRRSDIETFGRELEAKGRATPTIARRLCTITGFYRYAEEEGLIAHSPAVHVRRPRIDYESHAIGLDRNEVGGLLVAAGLGPAGEHALISLLALNGLRVSEAIGVNIEALGVERGHRTLTVLRKGGKTVTVPLAPRTAPAVDLAVGERAAGPIFVAGDGRRLDRHGAAGAMAALVVCCDVTFATVVAEYIAPIERVAPYEPGSLVKRELPCIEAVLALSDALDLLIVDGYGHPRPRGPAGPRRASSEGTRHTGHRCCEDPVPLGGPL